MSQLGLPAPGWEIPGDLGMEPGEGVIWGDEGVMWGLMPQSPPSKVPFPTEVTINTVPCTASNPSAFLIIPLILHFHTCL